MQVQNSGRTPLAFDHPMRLGKHGLNMLPCKAFLLWSDQNVRDSVSSGPGRFLQEVCVLSDPMATDVNDLARDKINEFESLG
jgi:hypothetical protein